MSPSLEQLPLVEPQPIVAELMALLKARPDLADALKKPIRQAERPEGAPLPQAYDFLQEMGPLIPTDRNLNAVRLRFYCLINLSPDGALQADASFRRWVRKFADRREAWLNAAESAQGEGRSALQSGKADRARDQRPIRSHSVP